jgi:hypothetical protein
MGYFYKQLLFVVVAIGVIFALPAKISHLIGLFAIGWAVADFAQVLFPRKDV